MKMRTRLFAMIMALVMLVGLLPVSAFAVGDAPTDMDVTIESTAAPTASADLKEASGASGEQMPTTPAGAEAEPHTHDFGAWTVTKEATEGEPGSEERACSVCGYAETVKIPALGTTGSTDGNVQTADTTVYSKFAKAYAIGASVYPSGGAQIVFNKVEAKAGEEVTFKLTLKNGYTLQSIECPVSLIPLNTVVDKWKFVMPENDIDIVVTLDAPQQQSEYNVTLKAAPAAGGTITGAGTYPAGTMVTVKATPNDGYRFVKWTGGPAESSKAEYSFKLDGNYNMFAVFELTHTVIYDANGGTISKVLNPWQADHGKVLKRANIEGILKANTTPPANHVFDYLEINGEKWTTDEYTVNKDTVIKIIWKDTSPRKLWVYTEGKTTDKGTVESGGILQTSSFGNNNYINGSSWTVTATPKSGYVFKEWRVSSTSYEDALTSTNTHSTNPWEFTLEEDTFAVAVFEAESSRKLWVYTEGKTTDKGTVESGGILQTSSFGNNNYLNGSSWTVTATPKSGYVFKEWRVSSTSYEDALTSTNTHSTNPWEFTLEEDTFAVAIFAALHTVTVSADPAEGGSVTGGGDYTEGESAMVSATANEGYVFDGWYDGDTKISDEASYAFAVAGNVALTAKFTPLATYPVWVGGVQATSVNAEDVLGNGTVSWDNATSTLTLNGINLTVTRDDYRNDYGSSKPWGDGVVAFDGIDATIQLVGNNTITCNEISNFANPILLKNGTGKTITITGAGSLTTDSYSNAIQNGFNQNCKYVVDGATLNLNNTFMVKDIVIRNGAKVNSKSESAAFSCTTLTVAGSAVNITKGGYSDYAIKCTEIIDGPNIRITDGSNVTVVWGGYSTYAVNAWSGIEVSGGAKFNVTNNLAHVAVYSQGNVTVTGAGSELHCSSTGALPNGETADDYGGPTLWLGNESAALNITGGARVVVNNSSANTRVAVSMPDLNMSGGVLKSDCTNSNAVYFWGNDVTVENADIEAASQYSNGIWCYGAVTIKDSDITTTGYWPALGANGDITINASRVEAAATNDAGIWSRSGSIKVIGLSDVKASGTMGMYLSDTSKTVSVVPTEQALIRVDAGAAAPGNEVEGSPFESETALDASVVRQQYVHIYGSAKVISHTVTVQADPAEGGIVTGGGDYTEGESATVTAAANEGYVFDGWYEGTTKKSGEASYTFTPDGDVTLRAKFKLLTQITDGAGDPLTGATIDVNDSMAWWFCVRSKLGAVRCMEEDITATSGSQVEYMGGGSFDVHVDGSELGLGEHDIVISYAGDDNHAPCSVSLKLKVIEKKKPHVEDFFPSAAKVNAPYTISGRVVDENGDPHGGQTLYFSIQLFENSANYAFIGSTTTDADGRFSCEISKYLPDAPCSRQICIRCGETETHLRLLEFISVRFTEGAIHTVTFKDGDNELFTQRVESGRNVTPPADPKKDGHSFEGWFANESLSAAFDFTAPITADTTVYAKFEPVTYTVALNAEPAEGGTVSGGGQVPAGQSVTVKAAANEGYEFAGWYEGADPVSWDGEHTIASVSGDMALTAKFIRMWTVTLDMNGGTIMEEAVVSMDFEDGHKEQLPDKDTMEQWVQDATWITGPADGEYIGAEITDANGTKTYQPGDMYTVISGATVKVLWKSTVTPPVTYTVTVDNGTSDKSAAEEGETVTLTADTAPTGTTFDKWVVNAGGVILADETADTTTFTMPAADVKVTATYRNLPPVTYTVTFQDGDTVLSTQTVNGGDKAVKPTDPAKTGYTFNGWYADSTLNVSFDFERAITADTTVYARFTKDSDVPPATITYTVTGGGNSTWTKGSSATVTITVKRSEADDTCFSHFSGVEIDGSALVNGTDYTAVSGSTVVTLKASALQKLAVGEHTVTVKFDDGKVSTGLTVKAAAGGGDPKKPSSPRTADESNLRFWILLVFLSILDFITTAAISRKKRLHSR